MQLGEAYHQLFPRFPVPYHEGCLCTGLGWYEDTNIVPVDLDAPMSLKNIFDDDVQ